MNTRLNYGGFFKECFLCDLAPLRNDIDKQYQIMHEQVICFHCFEEFSEEIIQFKIEEKILTRI